MHHSSFRHTFTYDIRDPPRLSNFPQECALLDYQLDVVKVVSGCMGTDELNKFGPQDEATMKGEDDWFSIPRIRILSECI